VLGASAFVEQICGLYFIGIEKQFGIQVQTGAPHSPHVGNVPCDDWVQEQGVLDALNPPS